MPRTEGKEANRKYILIGMKSPTEVERGHTEKYFVTQSKEKMLFRNLS